MAGPSACAPKPSFRTCPPAGQQGGHPLALPARGLAAWLAVRLAALHSIVLYDMVVYDIISD